MDFSFFLSQISNYAEATHQAFVYVINRDYPSLLVRMFKQFLIALATGY